MSFIPVAEAGPGDIIVPNYLVQNPDGSVGANFSGHVAAAGVDLQEAIFPRAPGVQTVAPTSAVDWLDPATQAIRQYLQGQRYTWNVGPSSFVQNELDLAQVDTAGDIKALLSLIHELGSGASSLDIASITVEAKNGAGTKDVSRTVLTSDGASDYAHTRSAFRAKRTAAQLIATNSVVKLQAVDNADAACFDKTGTYDDTLFRWTPLQSGLYLVMARLAWDASNGYAGLRIRKNSADYPPNAIAAPPGATNGWSVHWSDVVQMNGTSDFLECFAENGDGVTARNVTGVWSGYYMGQ